MNLSFDLYRVFYYVCKNMSITEAAKCMYVSQPAITKQIKNLESGLGKVLFIRDKKGLVLTDAGKELYDKIKDSVEQLSSIEEEAKEDATCLIRIVAGYNTLKNYVIRNISSFSEKHPNVKFELATYSYDESLEKLREDKADVIFLNMRKKDDSLNDLYIKKCLDLEDILVVSKDMKKNIPDKIKLIDLNNYPIICKIGSSSTRQNVEEYFRQNNLIFTPKYELSSVWLIEEYIKANKGVGLVDRDAILEDLKRGTCIEIKTDVELPHREIGYAVRKNYIHKNIVDEFISSIVS